MGFFKALSFLTVIRVEHPTHHDDKELAGWGRWYFLVGLLIGALAAGIDFLMVGRFSTLTSGVIVVTFISAINGGMHLDGLIDTFDAAFSMKPVEEKLKIMKESTVGALGVVAIILVILLKVTLISEIAAAERLKTILIFPAVSRGCLLLPAFLYKYPRAFGKGAGFVKYMTSEILLSGILIAAIAMFLLLQFKGLIILFAALAFSFVTANFFNKRFNGITGDVLGTINELTEVFVLFISILI